MSDIIASILEVGDATFAQKSDTRSLNCHHNTGAQVKKLRPAEGLAGVV